MITDNQNEIFDVVNEKDNVIRQAKRGEVHKNKDLVHRSIGVAVFNSKGELYLQQRSATKDTDPLCWTISCSGHVGYDPSTWKESMRPPSRCLNRLLPSEVSLSLYEETAHRELEEELGIRNLKLEKIAKYICRAPNETEIQMLFKTISDGPFKLHPQEIAQGKFFTRKELKSLLHKGKIKLSFMGKVALGKLGWI